MDERAETGQDFLVVSCILLLNMIFLFSVAAESEHDPFNVSQVFFFSFSRTNVCLFLQLLRAGTDIPVYQESARESHRAAKTTGHPVGGGERTGPGSTGITGDAREPFCALRYAYPFWGWKEDSIWNGTKQNYKVCCDRLISGTTKPRVVSRVSRVWREWNPCFRFLIIVFVHDCSHHVVL